MHWITELQLECIWMEEIEKMKAFFWILNLENY